MPLIPPELQRPQKEKEWRQVNPHRSMQQHGDTAFAKTGFSITKRGTLVPIIISVRPLVTLTLPLHYPAEPMSSVGKGFLQLTFQPKGRGLW